MENLAKVFRGSLMFIGLLALICGGFGVYKYKSALSQISHLNEYIENYVNNTSQVLEDKNKIISDYKKKVLELEKVIEELKKKKDRGRWWGELGEDNPLLLSSQEKWWSTDKSNDEIIEYYAENQEVMEKWFEDNGERIKDRFEKDGFDYRNLTVRDFVEIYINRDKL